MGEHQEAPKLDTSEFSLKSQPEVPLGFGKGLREESRCFLHEVVHKPVRFWLIKDAENLPIQNELRPMRIGALASRLAQNGHEVVWWASTFSHFLKKPIAQGDQSLFPEPGLNLRLLNAGGYQKNISPARVLHHCRFAWRLYQDFYRLDPPDLILCCYPMLETCYAALEYGRRLRVPVILDVRDVWPDPFVGLAPRFLQPLARLCLQPYFCLARNVLKRADGLTACSRGFLKWGLDYAERAQEDGDQVIYHGYPSLSFEEEPSEKVLPLLQKLQDKTVFVYSGTFSAVYNLSIVLQAAESLRHRADIHFLLMGKGTTFARVESLAKSLGNVTLTGWVKQSDLTRLLSISHVGLIPWDGPPGSLPNKMFEYLSASLPILGSIEGEFRELLAGNRVGYNYPAKDPSALARLILHLADSPAELREMSNSATEMFQESFNQEATSGEFQRYLEFRAGGSEFFLRRNSREV